MSFKFTKEDNYQKLPNAIQANLANFIEHRVTEFEEMLPLFLAGDEDAFRGYCHRVKGVALSYNFYKMDEIITFFQYQLDQNNISEIKKNIPVYQAYLAEISRNI